MIRINGDMFEGGGSILRLAVPLALGIRKPVEIYNIRKKRNKPGLRTQHLLGVQLLCDLTNSRLSGDEIGSTSVKITPGDFRYKKLNITIPTAASITLLIQMFQNYSILSNNDIKGSFVGGGSSVKFSPSWAELRYCIREYLKLFGLDIQLNLEKAGYFPKGKARGTFEINRTFRDYKIELTETLEEITQIDIYSEASRILSKAEVAERQITGTLANLQPEIKDLVNTQQVDYLDGPPGSCITAVVEGTIRKSYSVVGERGVRSEIIGENLANKINANLYKPGIDIHMSDQLIIPLLTALPGSKLLVRKTLHVEANLYVIAKFFDKKQFMREERGELILLTKL